MDLHFIWRLWVYWGYHSRYYGSILKASFYLLVCQHLFEGSFIQIKISEFLALIDRITVLVEMYGFRSTAVDFEFVLNLISQYPVDLWYENIVFFLDWLVHRLLIFVYYLLHQKNRFCFVLQLISSSFSLFSFFSF